MEFIRDICTKCYSNLCYCRSNGRITIISRAIPLPPLYVFKAQTRKTILVLFIHFYVHTVHFYCLLFIICTNKCSYMFRCRCTIFRELTHCVLKL